jgi:hypothetical protein
MFIHRPTRRFRKSVAGTTLAAAETTGLSVKGAVFYAPRRTDDSASASVRS